MSREKEMRVVTELSAAAASARATELANRGLVVKVIEEPVDVVYLKQAGASAGSGGAGRPVLIGVAEVVHTEAELAELGKNWKEEERLLKLGGKASEGEAEREEKRAAKEGEKGKK